MARKSTHYFFLILVSVKVQLHNIYVIFIHICISIFPYVIPYVITKECDHI